MDMVKVDPKLFVTCRLCLEDMGMYQITPVVQQQIKYCFDIDVDQFDGLPQLICGKCETILSEYFTRKRIFVGRQNALKAKLQVRKEIEGSLCPSPPHEAVSSSQQCDNEQHTRRKSVSRTKKRKLRSISSSSSSTQVSRDASASPILNTNHLTTESKKECDKKRSNRREPWEESYVKRYACKLCNKRLKFGAGFGNHVKTHTNILSKYQDILKNNCRVQLVKIDGKPNLTGNTNNVVLSHNKIRGPHDEMFVFYALYLSQEDEPTKPQVSNFESDDADEIIPKSTHAKRRRLLSGSSTDTVVLNDDKTYVTSELNTESKQVALNAAAQLNEEIECIDIDDSSNGSHQSDCLSVGNNDSVSVKAKDIEAIKNIIKVCNNKYALKRQELLDIDKRKAANNGPYLKHKLLSMGRKVINRPGLPCTGLLRFLESKNLVVKWIPMMTSNKDNYTRIMARQKGKDELLQENLGWKKINGQYLHKDETLQILPKLYFKVSSGNLPKTNSTTDQLIKKNLTATSESESKNKKTVAIEDELPNLDVDNVWNPNGVEKSSSNNTLCEIVPIQENKSPGSTLPTETLLFTDPDTKLLNANPVANPKQLPKKFNVTDTKHNQAATENISEHNYSHPNINVHESLCAAQEASQTGTEMCLPIITSTTSLAVPIKNTFENSTKCDNNPQSYTENQKEIEKPVPRIKVKPNSELMSERVLKNLCQQPTPDNIWVPNTTAAAGTGGQNVINITRVTSGHVLPNNIANYNTVNAAPANNQRSYVMLNTIELPNFKTESPIQYFRNLLQIHNIKLLDCHETLPPSAVCLIKFKLQFLRDSINQPVTLCLSVHCAGNVFSIGVRDPNQPCDFDLNKLSANWQWEILKIYTVRQDVIKKMMQNAQKISQEVYENTNRFYCLLKSINKVEDV